MMERGSEQEAKQTKYFFNPSMLFHILSIVLEAKHSDFSTPLEHCLFKDR